ncbi:MAG: MarR family transcriptional regulator [Dehalococcoidia bacterium]
MESSSSHDRERLVGEFRELLAAMRSPQMHGAPPLMDVDLTIPQLRVIHVLSESDAMRMSPLAEVVGTTLSACSHLVERLVQAGLVARSEDPGDRRAVLCSLTDGGHSLAERLRQSMPFERQEFVDRLSVEELGIMVQALHIVQREMLHMQARSDNA